VGLVFVGVGSATGVLSKSLEAAIIVMVIGTTFIAPALLRVVFKEPDSPSAGTAIAPESAEASAVSAE
jgi:hypothetical protein